MDIEGILGTNEEKVRELLEGLSILNKQQTVIEYSRVFINFF